jgi:hypothetical protein
MFCCRAYRTGVQMSKAGKIGNARSVVKRWVSRGVGSVGLLAGAASSTRLTTQQSAQAVGPCQGNPALRSGCRSAVALTVCRRALGSG